MSWGVATRNAVGLGLAGIVSLVSRAVQQAVAVVDPFFNYTTLLLPGNGTNGAQNNTFVDSSTNNFTITRNGNTTQGTFSPFSQTGWSNYFDGTGDYLSGIGTVSDFNFMHQSSALFTFECWVYFSDTTDVYIVDNCGSSTNNVGVVIYLNSTSKLAVAICRGVSPTVVVSGASTGSVPLNTWTHIAITYDQSLASDNAKFYINGVASGTANKTANAPSAADANAALRIGAYGAGTGGFVTGYISNLRITNSIVYTAAFTPSTTPLTAIANTELLTCQSNRFIDNSSNAFAITVNGNTSVQAFSPFNPAAAWSAATNGGSGYFDGSGDYLTAPDDAAFDLGSGAFTLECFAYLNARAGAYDTLIGQWNNSSDSWLLFLSGNTIQFYGNGALVKSESVTITLGQWYHFACTRDGSNNLRLYANGVELGSATAYSTTLINSTAPVSIGSRGDGLGTTNFNGYLSSVRVIKGTAQYTGATYTVPTAPVTAITNTSLLLNFTNAGIYDATAKNDLETVGNAQISTTQSKFGGSSMYFDGTGDYLLGPWNPPTDLGAGNFTIEFWMYPTAVGQSSVSYLFNLATNAGYGPILIAQSAGGYGIVLYSSSTGSSWNLASGSSFGTATANDWNHVALTRDGADVRLFLNGVLGTTLNWSTTALLTGSTYRPNIGSGGGYPNTFYTGYMQDLRVTKGYARYTTGFTPPIAAFPLT